MNGYHLIALSGRTSSFFDPVSRINLSLANPRAVYPVDRPLTSYLIAGLRQGILVDVYRTTELHATPAVKTEAPVLEQKEEAESVQEAPQETVVILAEETCVLAEEASIEPNTVETNNIEIQADADEDLSLKNKNKRNRKLDKDGA